MNHRSVSVKMAFLLKGRRTFRAFKRTLIGVFHAGVFSQSVTERKGCITLITEEVSLLAMDAPHMLIKVPAL